jgi:hypothetical protein
MGRNNRWSTFSMRTHVRLLAAIWEDINMKYLVIRAVKFMFLLVLRVTKNLIKISLPPTLVLLSIDALTKIAVHGSFETVS